MSKARKAQRRIPWFQKQLMRWFVGHARAFPWRRRSATHYECVVAEVLLQRTRAETVAAFYPRFLKAFASWVELSNAEDCELRRSLRPLGLWRRRAVSLKRLANVIASKKGRFPRRPEELEKLPNVGQYIANAVKLFCHGEREPLLDVNMARVLERFFGPRKMADIRSDPYLQELARKAVPRRKPREYNWAVLDLAALVCTASGPRCLVCPLRGRCRYFARSVGRGRSG
jgi:A/G-specific adenine glycosylase